MTANMTFTLTSALAITHTLIVAFCWSRFTGEGNDEIRRMLVIASSKRDAIVTRAERPLSCESKSQSHSGRKLSQGLGALDVTVNLTSKSGLAPRAAHLEKAMCGVLRFVPSEVLAGRRQREKRHDNGVRIHVAQESLVV